MTREEELIQFLQDDLHKRRAHLKREYEKKHDAVPDEMLREIRNSAEKELREIHGSDTDISEQLSALMALREEAMKEAERREETQP